MNGISELVECLFTSAPVCLCARAHVCFLCFCVSGKLRNNRLCLQVGSYSKYGEGLNTTAVHAAYKLGFDDTYTLFYKEPIYRKPKNCQLNV